MAEQVDAWTTWYEWQEPPATARDIRHHGDHMSHAFDRDLWSKLCQNTSDAVAAAYLHTNDPADRGMVTDVLEAVAWLSSRTLLLMYAVYEVRELLAGAAMSKEQVFDLWLERAGEMEL